MLLPLKFGSDAMFRLLLLLLSSAFLISSPKLYADSTARSKKAIQYTFNPISPAPLQKFLLAEHKLFTRRTYQFEELTTSYVKSVVDDELLQLKKTLQGLGYWSAYVQASITKKEDHYAVIFDIAPQELYTIAQLRLVSTQTLEPLELPENIPSMGNEASSEAILVFENQILRHYLNTGHATASFSKKEVLVDDENRTVSLLFQIEPGKRYHIGKVEIQGLDRTKEAFIQRRLLFGPHTLYNLSLIESTEEEIMATGLFSQVRTETLEPTADQIPLVIHLREGKSRSIALGLKVATNKTSGYRCEWQNRNFSGEGDLLALRAHNSSDETKAHLLYTKPDFFLDGTFLRASLEYNSINSVAFEENKWELYGNFEKKPYSRISLRYGANCSFVRSHNDEIHTEDILITFPINITWSSAIPQRLPKSGRSHTLHLEPHTALSQHPFTFLKMELKNSLYIPLFRGMTLACSAQVGTLSGSSQREIPLSTRYFLGGDQIMRGYPNNGLAPVDENQRLIGGRSFFAMSIEPRMEMAKGFYFTPFVDAGRVFVGPDLNFDERLAFSCGAGFHLDTLVGPLRLDIAFPLSNQPTDAPSYQTYLSIGTAF